MALPAKGKEHLLLKTRMSPEFCHPNEAFA